MKSLCPEGMESALPHEIVVESAVSGGPKRKGEILEVHRDRGPERYVVRWDDGHESLILPGRDARVVHLANQAGRPPVP